MIDRRGSNDSYVTNDEGSKMSDCFFSELDDLPVRQTIPIHARCGECGLYKHCKSPKMPIDGKGKRKIFILGESPGFHEDQLGRPFVGESGGLLDRTLSEYGISLREDCWIDNALICRPTKFGSNRTPTTKEIAHCRPNVIEAITKLSPENIILLGGSAIKSVIGWLWREDVGKASRWNGWQIPSQKLNAWICSTFHPAATLYNSNKYEGQQSEIRMLFFKQHLKAACELQGRPWKKVPDWDKKVIVELDVNKAAEVIESLIGTIPVAFDYECDSLKPDSDSLRIICSSMSNGKTTIAYPWYGKAVKATKKFLRSDTPKIASNMKYEQRWSLAKLGFSVENWFLDTMQAAHVLDNRRGITSIKFQAFIHLGMDIWDEAVKPYMESKNSNTSNRLQEVNMETLLKYCGIDSLMEWKIAKIQAEQLGIEWPK